MAIKARLCLERRPHDEHALDPGSESTYSGNGKRLVASVVVDSKQTISVGVDVRNSDRDGRKRGVWLVAYLLYIAFANAWGSFRAFVIYRDLVVHRDPNLLHWPFLLLGILSAGAVIGVVGIWFWRKWGAWAYAACWAIAFGLSAYLGVPFWSYVLLLSQIALLYALLQPRWDLFDGKCS